MQGDMGAAKRNGTFEQRAAIAKERNAKLEWAIQHGKDPELKKALTRRGIRPVVNLLVQNQVIKL